MGCLSNDNVYIAPAKIEMSSDDHGTIFLLSLTNCTKECVTVVSTDLDLALKFATYSIAGSNRPLTKDFYDDDWCEPAIEEYVLSPFCSTDYATELPMKIGCVSAGDNCNLSIAGELVIFIGPDRKSIQFNWTCPTLILSRKDITKKILSADDLDL